MVWGFGHAKARRGERRGGIGGVSRLPTMVLAAVLAGSE